MTLKVVKYGHPALRKKGARVEKITPEIHALIANMFETMYDARGIGLAAQQVGEPVQVTVLDVREVSAERPSSLELNGKPADIAAFMPLALINPEVKPVGEPVAGPEGCLSFPEVYADILRPESVDVVALNEKGELIEFRCGGLLARAVQHEVDHLNGILFIDRMDTETKDELKPQLEAIRKQAREESAVDPREQPPTAARRHQTIIEQNPPTASAPIPTAIRSYLLTGQSCLAKALTMSVSTPKKSKSTPTSPNTADERSYTKPKTESRARTENPKTMSPLFDLMIPLAQRK